MKTAVIILNWNGRKMMETYLPSVCKYTQGDDVQVVVADNGSTDDSIEFLQREYPQVALIQLDQNYGFAEGYNKAIAQVDAEYVVLLNSDVEVTENWHTVLTEYMDAHPEVAACQPKILAYYDKAKFEHAGAAGGFIDKYRFPYCRGRVLGKVEEDRGQYDQPIQIFWATGAALFIRKKAYDEVGGLDGTFFAHMEEIDLCWRLNSRGYQVMCVPQSKVYHLGGGTLNVDNPRKTYLNFRNNLLMIYKNETEERVGSVLRARKFFDNLAALMYLMKGDKENFEAVRKARKEFHSIKHQYDDKRAENMRLQQVTQFPFNYDGSIVWGYYAFNKKLYTDLK